MPNELLPVPHGWSGAVSEFLMSMTVRGLRERTIDLRVRWVRRFARFVEIGPWDVTDREIMVWSASHDWATDTRRSAHASVRAFYEWACTSGYVERVPVIPMIRASAPMPHPASEAAITDARSIADSRVSLMVRLASEAGLRRGEVARIHSRDLERDLAGWSLVVHGKGGKERRIPLSDSLADALRQTRAGFVFPGNDHGHLSPDWVGHLVGAVLPQGVTMHALRHRFASRAYQVTGDLLGVQAALGHASPDTTLRYVALPNDALRRVMQAAA